MTIPSRRKMIKKEEFETIVQNEIQKTVVDKFYILPVRAAVQLESVMKMAAVFQKAENDIRSCYLRQFFIMDK